MAKLVEATDVKFSYDDDLALDGANFELSPGESLAVIGPNGSGKSTLLHLMARLEQPGSGCLLIRPTHPAMVLQTNELNYTVPISVRDTVGMGRYPSLGLFSKFSTKDRDLTEASLARLEISNIADAQLSELSGGQRQRAAVAQALNQDSELLLLDEPVNGLDLVSRDLIMEALAEECKADRGVVITTHNLEEARSCDKVLLLNRQQVAWGAPDKVLTEENLRTAFGRDFTKVGDQLVIDDGHHH